MPKRIKVDGKKLAKTIKDGTPQAEVMKKFGFKNVTQLKVAYANVLMETGKPLPSNPVVNLLRKPKLSKWPLR